MREYWLPVKFNDKYEVSNLGRVRNARTGLILKMHKNQPNGYYRISIDGRHYYVHRLVADTFYDGDHSNMDVNHIDGDKYNNMLANLEWCTRSENIKHAFANGLKYPSSVRVVRCAFCIHRYEYDICMGKPDSFYCGYGQRP